MENKELTGAMFPHKKDNEKQPDYKGTVKVGGVNYRIAGWNRKGKESNIPYMYIALKPVEQEKKQAPKHTPQETVQQVAKAVGGPETLAKETIVDEVPF